MSIYNEDIKFKIVNMIIDRSPNGVTIIKFITAEDSIIGGIMKVSISNREFKNKEYIRDAMLRVYFSLVEDIKNDVKIVRVGDIL